MATLADLFLADLDELSNNEADVPLEDDADIANKEEDVDGDLADLETLNYVDLDSVPKLQKSQRFADIMHYNFIGDKYRPKFPELESLAHHPIDYARVVQKIGNEMDVTLVDLEGLLPSAIIMVDACDGALALNSVEKKVVDFVESRMGFIAPNLAAFVGNSVAAKLMGTTGGLAALAKMPACNVQLLSASYKRKNVAWFSIATSQYHHRLGYIEQTEIFQTTSPALKMLAGCLLAVKSTLAARVESTRGDPSGNTGKAFREEIHKKIEKWQEPSPARQPKLLAVPDYSEPKKKKRGGRRLRKMKQRYAIIDMRKLANRMQFGIPEEIS